MKFCSIGLDRYSEKNLFVEGIDDASLGPTFTKKSLKPSVISFNPENALPLLTNKSGISVFEIFDFKAFFSVHSKFVLYFYCKC